ncbi:MAG: alpha/beta hydrolase, partial [Gemmataceae bacterium]
DDCRHDLAAWIDWLGQKGSPRVTLIGHSLGAVKCLYALAQDTALEVRAVVAVSPPRLSYSWFCQSPEAATFLETYQRAEALVQGGEAGNLMEITLPLSMVITAAGYLEKYGPDERYNYLRFLRSVPGPVLVTLGDLEIGVSPAFRGAAEAIAELAGKKKDLKVETIPDADHFYTNARAEVIDRVTAWLGSL